MATRQYIGARYVPKFYQNSVDGSTQWEANVVYEPLIYVTLVNGHMYISKKQVPATVGSPASNIEYWLDIGSYNGFIEQLQSEIDTINDVTIPAVQADVALKQDITDNSLDTTDKTVVGAINEVNTSVQGVITDLANKQNKTDNNFATTAKTVVGAVNELDSDVQNLSDELHNIFDRKYIIISDSYGARTVNWIDKLVTTLGLTSSDYFTSSVNGSGFAHGTTFENQLTTLASNITDKNSITDIIVGGGFNDRGVAAATVKTAIGSFVSYAKTTFPNAKVHIGFISWSFNSEFISELVVNNVLNTYKQCGEYGAIYIDHSDEVMHDSTLFEQEAQSPYTLFLGYQYVHPSAAGAQAIANCIANYIKCGTGVSYDGYAEVTPTLTTGVTIGNGDFNFLMRKSGNNISVARKSYGLVTFNFANAVNLNGSTIELGQLDSGLVAGVTTTNANTKAITFIPVVGFALYGGSNVNINGMLLIANNRIYLHCYLDGATSVTTIGLFGCAGTFNTDEV